MCWILFTVGFLLFFGKRANLVVNSLTNTINQYGTFFLKNLGSMVFHFIGAGALWEIIQRNPNILTQAVAKFGWLVDLEIPVAKPMICIGAGIVLLWLTDWAWERFTRFKSETAAQRG